VCGIVVLSEDYTLQLSDTWYALGFCMTDIYVCVCVCVRVWARACECVSMCACGGGGAALGDDSISQRHICSGEWLSLS
jgi:hypothetical protein